MGIRKTVVLDTNVMISAMRSNKGASHAILRALHAKEFDCLLSVPLVLEYESVAKRPGMLPHLSERDIEAILDMICSRSMEQKIFFQWRPFLKDPNDDMLVELAIAGRASTIVTSNIGDFEDARKALGLEILTPKEFLIQQRTK